MKHYYNFPNGIVSSKKQIPQILFAVLLFFSLSIFSQDKKIELKPFLETATTIDSLVTPNQFYVNIDLSEILTRGRVSMKDIESNMKSKLQALGIKADDQLTLINSSSRYRAFFPRKGKSYKLKTYYLLLTSNALVAKVISELKMQGVYNLYLKEVYHSEAEQIQLALREKAINKAKVQAELTLKPLNQKIVKAVEITDSDLANAKSLQQPVYINGSHYNFNYHYNQNINLGLKLNKIPIKTTVFVKFEIE